MITVQLSIPATTLNLLTPSPSDDVRSVDLLLVKDPTANSTKVTLTVDGTDYTLEADDFKEAARKLDQVLSV